MVWMHLADMVKGYEAASEWMGTEEGAAWFEGKRRKKLENRQTPAITASAGKKS